MNACDPHAPLAAGRPPFSSRTLAWKRNMMRPTRASDLFAPPQLPAVRRKTVAGVARWSTALVLMMFSACSLQNLETRDCESDAECAAAFGFGATCGDDGFCTSARACTSSDQCAATAGAGSLCSAGTCTSPTVSDCADDERCVREIGFGATCRTNGTCTPAAQLDCDDDSVCAATYGDDAVCHASGICTVFDCAGSDASCAARLGAGATCADDNRCVGAEVTDCTSDDACAEIFGYGATCSDDGRCDLEAVISCDNDERCESNFGLGSACASTNRCTRPTVTNCESDSACVSAGGFGATCRDDGACDPSTVPSCDNDAICATTFGQGARCTAGRCTAPTTCEDDASCATNFGAGSTCNELERCTAPTNVNCEDDEACVERFGVGSTCRSDGSSCTSATLPTCANDAACADELGFGYRCLPSGICAAPVVGTCETDEVCRRAYGWGVGCGTDGTCEDRTSRTMCRITYPQDFWQNPSAYRDDFVIGSLLSFSNNRVEQLAIELAVRQVNGAGGLADRRFAVVFCDYGTVNDETAANLAEYLVNDIGIPVIVGGLSSSSTFAAFNAVRTSDALIVSPAATSPQLSVIDNTSPSDSNPGRLWRLVPPADEQVRIIVEQILALHPDGVTVRIIAENSPDGIELETLLGEELDRVYEAASEGDALVLQSFFDRANAAQRTTIVENGLAGNPDVVIFVTGLPTTLQSLLAVAGTTSGYSTRDLFITDVGHDILILRESSNIPDEILMRVIGTRPAPGRGPDFNRFANIYRTQNPTSEPLSAAYSSHSYDATWLVLYGIAWAHLQNGGDITGPAIAVGLRKLNDFTATARNTSTAAATWSAVLAAFEAGNRVNIGGASGGLNYDLTTEELIGGEIEIWRINVDCDDDAAVDGRCFEDIDRIAIGGDD